MSPDFSKQMSVLVFLLSRCDKDFYLYFYLDKIKDPFLSQIPSDELGEILNLFAEKKLINLYLKDKGLVNIIINNRMSLEYALSISQEYGSELNEILKNQKEEIESQKEKLESIYGFLPENIVNEINESKEKLTEILSSIDKSEFLLPLKPKIEEISQYLEKTEKVIKNYENIYLNIIKPIKSEGKQGIKATATWAVLSIIVTAFLSIYFSHKTFDKDVKSDTQGKSVSYVQSNVNLSPLERKVDFLINETMGLNESFNVDTSRSTILEMDEQILFSSPKDKIVIQPWMGDDYIIGNACYPVVDLAFFLNNRRITSQGLKGLILKISKVNPNSYRGDVITVVEKDTLIFKNHSILIDKIFCTASKCAPFGDKFNGIRIKKLK